MPESTFDVYSYARRLILPSLALQNHPFVIQRPGQGGTSSTAWKLSVERGPSLLVRFFSDLGRARRSATALKHLERHDLPAPRLKHASLGFMNRFSRGNGVPRYSTTETWIEGTRALEAPDEAGTALSVAGILARFHAVTRGRCGPPTLLGDPRPYAKTTMRLAMGMIHDLQARGTLSPGEATEATARFNAWMGMLLKQTTFHLCLNDANRRNFILLKDKSLVAIDVQRVSYEPCAEEVANALYHFCRRDESLAERFLETYLAAATPSSRETWRRNGPFFTALNTLKRLHQKVAGASAPAHVPAAPDAQAVVASWKLILTTLPAPPRLWPEPGSAPPEESTELSRQLM
jgi:hypothetical protein